MSSAHIRAPMRRCIWRREDSLAETFSQAEIKALENPQTPSHAAQTWASGRVPRSMQKLKAGLTPSEVITAATRNAAQIVGLDQLGLVGLRATAWSEDDE